MGGAAMGQWLTQTRQDGLVRYNVESGTALWSGYYVVDEDGWLELYTKSGNLSEVLRPIK